MVELHVMHALRNKRAELAGTLIQLEQQLVRQRADLTHLDATMRLFDPDIQPNEIPSKQQRRPHSAWFRHGECLRLIYDELRDAPQPMSNGSGSTTLLGAGRLVPDVVGDGRGWHGEARFADKGCSYD